MDHIDTNNLSHLLCLFSYQFFQSGVNEDLSRKIVKAPFLTTLQQPFKYPLSQAVLYRTIKCQYYTCITLLSKPCHPKYFNIHTATKFRTFL